MSFRLMKLSSEIQSLGHKLVLELETQWHQI